MTQYDIIFYYFLTKATSEYLNYARLVWIHFRRFNHLADDLDSALCVEHDRGIIVVLHHRAVVSIFEKETFRYSIRLRHSHVHYSLAEMGWYYKCARNIFIICRGIIPMYFYNMVCLWCAYRKTRHKRQTRVTFISKIHRCRLGGGVFRRGFCRRFRRVRS